MHFFKRAVVGIGMLLIFIATILVSAIAAGVLISTTGVLQESAIAVSQNAQNRLITGLDVISVVGIANTTNEELTGMEIQVRLRAGSPPVQLKFTDVSFVWAEAAFSLDYNTTLVDVQCQIVNLSLDNNDYCAFNLIGNNDSIVDDGEIYTLRFPLPNSSYLGTIEDFELTIQPRSGALNILNLKTPELMLTPRVRIR